MKPTDLRIGCYVKLRDSGEIVRVERLSRRKCGFFHGNDKSRSYYRRFSEIEPVLIYDHWQNINCRQLTWCGYEDGDEMYLYYYHSWPHKTFRYIHELQNIHYALTGNEIEIEL